MLCNYIKSVAAHPSYKDYSLNCGTVEPCVLTAISLNTDNVKKTFTVGETFNSTGLVVTAAYSNCSDKTVTPTSVTTPDLTAAGNKTVTVSYTENNVTITATYQISVTEPVKYNVTWSVNGVPGTPVQYVLLFNILKAKRSFCLLLLPTAQRLKYSSVGLPIILFPMALNLLISLPKQEAKK